MSTLLDADIINVMLLSSVSHTPEPCIVQT